LDHYRVLSGFNGPFSVLAWIKGGAAGQAIISEPSGANWLAVDSSDGSLMTELTSTNRSGTPLLSEAAITDGDWHRIALVSDGLYRMLYIDSIAVAPDMHDGFESSSDGLYFGTYSVMSPGTFWSDLIYDVRIYNRVVIP
jgi:hypothetical protein